MPTFKITLAYDGTEFVGWQRQAAGVSIQGLIEDALRDLDGRDVAVAGAGRTDAGVHALGQVAGFALQRAIAPDVLLRALNARLPESVRIVAAEEASDAFHPRFGAREKRYRYRIWNGGVGNPFEQRYAWHVHEPLDVDAMRCAAPMVEGHHDFAAFQASGSATKTTERHVFSSLILRQAQDERGQAQDDRGGDKDALMVSLSNHEPVITYEVAGNGFLRHMVRTIVGTLVEIGRGRRPPEWMRDVIRSRDRSAAGPTAPPHGLFLVGVTY